MIATAPLLFGTNGQINVLVPDAVTAYIGGTVDIVVNFGYATGATMKSSAPFQVNVAATTPGIFTIGASGQGDGAILDSNYSVVTNSNPAGMRSTASDSDVVQFYVTGLGAPDSTGDNATSGAAAWSADCVSLASYLTSLNGSAGSALTNLDGTVVQSNLLNTNRLPPCVLSGSANVPSVSIGGVPATVLYAGFVPDSVAGLYQINATLPGTGSGPFTSATGATISSLTTAVQLPVTITANGLASQSGVTLWVSPRLKVTGPTGSALTGTVGIPWSSSNNVVIATQGTAPYRYALTSGLLPSGLSLNPTTGAVTGTPAAHTSGSYAVTVTATDSANVPVKGTVSFTLTVAGGLFMTSTGTAPYYATFGSASASLTTVKAAGGVFPYTFAITTPATLPVGMTVNATTGVVGTTALTPAGSYTVTVTAADASATPALTGSITFDIIVALNLSHTAPVSRVSGAPGTLSTVSVTGNSGTVAYALDATSLAAGFTIDSATGAVGSGTAVAGTASVTITATDGSAPVNGVAAGVGITTFNVTVT
ncbi:MAG: Ig family protein [Bryobacterales bacterium]|nr:Ig family protein [Bryobacterales bacterium]